MGISDEDYANAIEHQRLHERALMQLEKEKQEEKKMSGLMNSLGNLLGAGQQALGTNGLSPHQQAAQQAALAQQTGITISTAGTNTPTWVSNVAMTQSGSKVLNEQDLQHDAMKAPLSALIDMWTVRYSGEWVSEADFQEDDFWRLALIRLVGANKLEKHHLANQYAAVYRIIE